MTVATVARRARRKGSRNKATLAREAAFDVAAKRAAIHGTGLPDLKGSLDSLAVLEETMRHFYIKAPFSACRRAVRFDVRGIDHLRIRRSSTPGQFPERVFPDAAPSPTHKAVIDRGWRTVLGRAIAPATTAFQHMDNAADHTAIFRPFDAPDIVGRCGSIRFHCSSLSQNKFCAYPNPLPISNQDRILSAQN